MTTLKAKFHKLGDAERWLNSQSDPDSYFVRSKCGIYFIYSWADFKNQETAGYWSDFYNQDNEGYDWYMPRAHKKAHKYLASHKKTIEDFIMRRNFYEEFDEDDEIQVADIVADIDLAAASLGQCQRIYECVKLFDEMDMTELKADIDYLSSLLTKSFCERWLVPNLPKWDFIERPGNIPNFRRDPEDCYYYSWVNSWFEFFTSVLGQMNTLEYLKSLGIDISPWDESRYQLEKDICNEWTTDRLLEHCPYGRSTFVNYFVDPQCLGWHVRQEDLPDMWEDNFEKDDVVAFKFVPGLNKHLIPRIYNELRDYQYYERGKKYGQLFKSGTLSGFTYKV